MVELLEDLVSDQMISELDLREIHAIQSKEEERAKAEKLPSWVKCMYCGCRPSWGNLLGEVVRHSSALACQKCMKERGKIFGLNVGQTQLDGKPTSEGDNNALITVSS